MTIFEFLRMLKRSHFVPETKIHIREPKTFKLIYTDTISNAAIFPDDILNMYVVKCKIIAPNEMTIWTEFD